MKLRLLASILAVTTIVACSPSKDGNEPVQKKDSTSQSQKQQQKSGKYSIKSATLELSFETEGPARIKAKNILIFDDYGNKEYSELKTEAGAMMDVHQVQIVNNGVYYSINMIEKTGSESNSPLQPKLYFCELNDAMKKDKNIKEEGGETILGKPATIYTMNDVENDMKATYSVWQCVPIKIVVSAQGMTIKQTVTKIDETTPIDPAIFSPPSDVKLTKVTPQLDSKDSDSTK